MIAQQLRTPLRYLRARLHAYRQASTARGALEHVSGPKSLRFKGSEVAVVLVGRNVAYYLPEFYDYYRSLGASWFVYLDNGSEDDSVELARRLGHCSVYRCDVDFKHHERPLRQTAVSRVREGWCLCVDADERLEYPNMKALPLPALARAMDGKGWTALVAQMLEMVPDGPLSRSRSLGFSKACETFTRCSLRSVSAYPYHSDELPFAYYTAQNETVDPALPFLFGGLRRSLFGEDCCLSKHVFFRTGFGVMPMVHPHISTGLTVAPVTVLLKHYKFAGDVVRRELKLLAEDRIAHGEARARMEELAADEDRTFVVEGMLDDPSLEYLYESGFLFSTPEGETLFNVSVQQAEA